MDGLTDIGRSFLKEYKQQTPTKLKVLDAFLVYAALTAGVQFLYMLLVGSFPFNSFLAGFIGSLAFFALTASLRAQVDPSSKDFQHLSHERAFADYAISVALLFLVVWLYMG